MSPKKFVIIIFVLIVFGSALGFLYVGRKVADDSLTEVSAATLELGNYCMGLGAKRLDLSEIQLEADRHHWQLAEKPEGDVPPLGLKGQPWRLKNSGISYCWLGINAETKRLENLVYLPD